MGDVALTVPVLKHVSTSNPDAHFIVVSDLKWGDLFLGIERVSFQGFDLKHHYIGFWGIIRIFRVLLKQYQFHAVADLHAVIRSHLLRTLFFIIGKQVAYINKGRSDKALITNQTNKYLHQLPHTTQRYLSVFEKLGLAVNLQLFNENHIGLKKPLGTIKRIGIAPFARHSLKMYPIEKMEQVVQYFDKEGYALYLFGSGKYEKKLIAEWNQKYKQVVSMTDTITLSEELKIISNLDVMVSMDSANMHLASNENVPVVSIWGPTHPHAGFYGYRQDPRNAVQLDLPCRPCSIYGNKPCYRGDHACMQEIKPACIISKIEELTK